MSDKEKIEVLTRALIECTNSLRTFSPEIQVSDQQWTSYDQDALENAFDVLKQVGVE